jgi:hypothetical protein
MHLASGGYTHFKTRVYIFDECLKKKDWSNLFFAFLVTEKCDGNNYTM